jgi:hypothetical protein
MSGDLGDGHEGFDQRFDDAWQSAIDVQAQAASLDSVERLWGPPVRWPTYADRKLRTKRLARHLAAERASWADAEILVEQRLTSADGRIYGIPDLVVRRPPPHRIADFKTGGVLDDEGVIHQRYRRQILIYAHLEAQASGSLPTQGVVRPLRGNPIAFEISSHAVLAEVDNALTAMRRFNSSVAEPEQLARPSTTTCRTCPHTGRCEPFWRMIAAAAPSELGAVGGVVTAVHSTDSQGFAIHVMAHEGNAGSAEVAVRGIPAPLAPWLASIPPGEHVRIVGLAAIGGTAASFAPRGMLRVDHVG